MEKQDSKLKGRFHGSSMGMNTCITGRGYICIDKFFIEKRKKKDNINEYLSNH